MHINHCFPFMHAGNGLLEVLQIHCEFSVEVLFILFQILDYSMIHYIINQMLISIRRGYER